MAALPVIASIAAIASAGASTYQALTSKPKGAPPTILTPPKPADATADQDAQAKRQQRARLDQQRSALAGTKQRDTVLTGTTLGSAPTATKSLLGM